ncbi:hypothetical protein [Microlunatus endophyticus]
MVVAVLGLSVGVWAAGLPKSFYSSFPGLGLHWIEMMGAYDEHLVRDVGFMYLALSTISIAAALSRTAAAGRLASLGWTVFGAFHFLFHVTHLMGGVVDVVGNIVSLGLSLALGLALLFPSRVCATTREARA